MWESITLPLTRQDRWKILWIPKIWSFILRHWVILQNISKILCFRDLKWEISRRILSWKSPLPVKKPPIMIKLQVSKRILNLKLIWIKTTNPFQKESANKLIKISWQVCLMIKILKPQRFLKTLYLIMMKSKNKRNKKNRFKTKMKIPSTSG